MIKDGQKSKLMKKTEVDRILKENCKILENKDITTMRVYRDCLKIGFRKPFSTEKENYCIIEEKEDQSILVNIDFFKKILNINLNLAKTDNYIKRKNKLILYYGDFFIKEKEDVYTCFEEDDCEYNYNIIEINEN